MVFEHAKREGTASLYYEKCVREGKLEEGRLRHPALFKLGEECYERLNGNRPKSLNVYQLKENLLERNSGQKVDEFKGLVAKIKETVKKSGKVVGRIDCDFSRISDGEIEAIRVYRFADQEYVERCKYDDPNDAETESLPTALKNLQSSLLNYDMQVYGPIVHISRLKRQ